MNTSALKTIGIILFSICAIGSISAQTQFDETKKYYIDKDGRLFWNKRLPVYIRIAPSPSDSGLLMKSEVTKDYTNPYFLDTEGKNRIRSEWATDQKTGETVYPQFEVIWEVYADGVAPSSKLVFQKSPKGTKGKDIIYGSELLVEIQSYDETSGIDKIYYSINGSEYKLYNSPFKLETEGYQKILYYAVDHVGNVEKAQDFSLKTDQTPPKTFYNITGISDGDIIALSTKIYLSAEDTLSGVKGIYYRIDNEQEKQYQPGTNIAINQLADGDHILTFYSIDNVGNKEPENTLHFYLDKTAPIIASDILGDRYLMDDKIFFSGRTKMKLTAIDNKAGVEDIFYSVNNEKFQKYDQPFYLPSVPGIHIVKYFATDRMKNNSDAGTSKFEQYKHVVSRIYVDLTGPIMNYEIVGDKYKTRDTLFINSNTKLKFNASDKESGLQYISYSINTDPDETKYGEPIQFNEPGFKHVVFYAYDNVNNRNRSELSVYVDNEGPEIKYNYSITSKGNKDSLDVYPGHLALFLGATDKIVGARDIYYSLNNATEIKYNNSISGFKKLSVNELKIRANDYLNNSAFILLRFYVD